MASGGERPPAAEVGLGAGASAATAPPARKAAATTAARKTARDLPCKPAMARRSSIS